MINRKFLKRDARSILRSARVSPYLFALLFLGIILLLNGIDAFVSFDFQYVAALQKAYPFLPLDASMFHAPFPAATVTFVAFVTSLLSVVLNGGWILYHLGIRRGEHQDYATLFDGFSLAGKLILLHILTSLFVALWSFLFVIPGIIAAYRYRFAVYILCQHPDLSVRKALALSTRLTSGYKWQLFLLDLSFLGWYFLRALTFDILGIWVLPYETQTRIGFYQKVKANKAAESQSFSGSGGFDSDDPISFL